MVPASDAVSKPFLGRLQRAAVERAALYNECSIRRTRSCRFFSNLSGTPADRVPVGVSVQVDFVEAGPGRLIPE